MSHQRVVLIITLFLLLILSSCGSDKSTSTSAPTIRPTAHSTQVSQAYATSTNVPNVNEPTILGANLRAFVAKYGQPNDHSTVSGGLYHFQRYAGSNIDFLAVQTDAADGSAYAKRVEGINVQAPDDSKRSWSSSQASTICAGFLPHDAVYKRKIALANNGYDKIYHSASLASMFPASAFTDASQNQVEAGMFDVQYIVQSDSTIASCDFFIGTQ